MDEQSVGISFHLQEDFLKSRYFDRVLHYLSPRSEVSALTRRPIYGLKRRTTGESDPTLADGTGIQWTDATWNPTTGCSKVSPGCKNCYAERLASRLQKMGNPKYRNGFDFTTHSRTLDLPLKWKKPRKIFVNSMSDLFHESMPLDFLKRCFDVMVEANWHVFQILTKRPQRLQSFAQAYGRLPDHVWIGTSVELAMFKKRIDLLRETLAKIRFVSFEPLLGPLGEIDLTGISWAIVGGESGPNHRPVQSDWVKDIRRQCFKQGVAFFFKQWGGRTPKSGGRLLDGREWNQYPSSQGQPMTLPLALQ